MRLKLAFASASILFISLAEFAIFRLVFAVINIDSSMANVLCFSSVVLHGFWAFVSYKRHALFWTSVEAATKEVQTQGSASHIEELLAPAVGTKDVMCASALESLSAISRKEVAARTDELKEYRDFVESWVHEAKTPLAAAKLSCQNNPSEASSKTLLALDEIDSYIDQALFYARLTSFDRDYVIRELNLESVVTDVVRSQARQFIHTKMGVSIDPSLKVAVYSDPKWLRFLLTQFTTNALKYLDPEKESHMLSFRANIKGQGSAQECVELIISDTGIGIEEADLPRVFDKGFVGENGRKKTQEKSTGLGLYLAKNIADRLNVGLSISSKVNVGTSVHILFPTKETIL